MSRAAPVGRRRLRTISHELTDRDWDVIRSVSSLRFATARQLEALHFTNHASPLSASRTARRVLERLSKDDLLSRLDRRIGGVRAGSASYVYRLGPVGDRLVRQDQPRRRKIEPSVTFLDHTLAVTQLVVDLTLACRAGRCELLKVETEPACWRKVSAPLARPDVLKPDLHVVLGIDAFQDHWFVEVDRGTEHLPTIRRKCALYERYYRSGVEQRTHGVFPKIVWSVPDERRARQLREAVPKPNGESVGLFNVAVAPELVESLVGGTT